MTLRELIKSVDAGKAADYVFDKDRRAYPHDPVVRSERCHEGCRRTIETLLAKPASPPGMPIVVAWETDRRTGERFVEVNLRNPAYEPPPEGAKPWGGPPPSAEYYDCNLEKHVKDFGFGFGHWERFVDSEVVDEAGLEPHALLGEILWDLTFYGFAEEAQEEVQAELDRRIEDYKSGRAAGTPWEDAKNDLKGG